MKQPAMAPRDYVGRDPGRMAALRCDAEFVIYRLEEAGRTLLALPGKGCAPNGYGSGWPDVVHKAIEAYGYGDEANRAPIPSAAAIGRMDEAFAWISHISLKQTSHRRIVLMRSLVSPITERHRWSWRRIGRAFGWDHRAVQRWHAQGINMIVDSLLAEARRNMFAGASRCGREREAVLIEGWSKNAVQKLLETQYGEARILTFCPISFSMFTWYGFWPYR